MRTLVLMGWLTACGNSYHAGCRDGCDRGANDGTKWCHRAAEECWDNTNLYQPTVDLVDPDGDGDWTDYDNGYSDCYEQCYTDACAAALVGADC